MLQPTDPKKQAELNGGMHESHCKGEIEWTLLVDGGRDL